MFKDPSKKLSYVENCTDNGEENVANTNISKKKRLTDHRRFQNIPVSGGDIEERGEVGGHDPKKQIPKFTKINLSICYRILKIVAPILKNLHMKSLPQWNVQGKEINKSSECLKIIFPMHLDEGMMQGDFGKRLSVTILCIKISNLHI